MELSELALAQQESTESAAVAKGTQPGTHSLS
jgi:hypothetical protein